MKRVGVSELRKMNAKYVRELAEPVEICHHNQPLHVLIPFKVFLAWQDSHNLAESYVGPSAPESGGGE